MVKCFSFLNLAFQHSQNGNKMWLKYVVFDDCNEVLWQTLVLFITITRLPMNYTDIIMVTVSNPMMK